MPVQDLIVEMRKLVELYKDKNPGTRVSWSVEVTDQEKNMTRLEEKDGGR